MALLPNKIINFINSNISVTNSVLNEFDEPTYLSFSFDFEIGKSIDGIDLDHLPEGLLLPEGDENSAIEYLKRIGYSDRATNIKSFINLLEKLQNKFYWSLESISGLDAIFSSKLDEGSVIRLKEKPLTLKFRETLDLKIYAMFDLLKKSTYDYMFMRQILPDIMRYFTFRIYIYEVRLFHKPRNAGKRGDVDFDKLGAMDKPYNFEQKLKQDVSDVENFIKEINSGQKQKELEEKWNKLYNGVGSTLRKSTGYFLTVLNDSISVIELVFKNCEFDLQSIKFSPFEELSVSAKHEPANFSININPGYLIEIGYYPIIIKAINDAVKSEKDVKNLTYRNFNQELLNKVDFYSKEKDYINKGEKNFNVLIEALLGEDATKDFYVKEKIYEELHHLGDADDIVKRKLQDALSGALYDYIKANIRNEVSAAVGGVYLGNANKVSIADIKNLLTSRPESVIGQLSNVLSKATSQSVANLFIAKLIESLPPFSSKIGNKPFNI
jgi:hypothetical protein